MSALDGLVHDIPLLPDFCCSSLDGRASQDWSSKSLAGERMSCTSPSYNHQSRLSGEEGALVYEGEAVGDGSRAIKAKER